MLPTVSQIKIFGKKLVKDNIKSSNELKLRKNLNRLLLNRFVNVYFDALHVHTLWLRENEVSRHKRHFRYLPKHTYGSPKGTLGEKKVVKNAISFPRNNISFE